MSRTQLILDVAGVIVTNFSSTYWVEIAQLSQTPSNTIKELIKKEVREALWTGSMSEQDFWEWLNSHCKATIEPKTARELLKKHLELLPSANHVSEWSQSADIHLLSNHRHEWILELLEPIRPYLQTITISSQVGCCKPEPEIYNIVQAKINNNRTIYVDDQEKNFIPARELGWTTKIADIEGRWADEITKLLQD